MFSKDLNWWLEWSATFMALAGAVATVLKFDPINIVLLNTSCILFVAWAYRINRLSLIIVNGGLLIIYAAGLIMRL